MTDTKREATIKQLLDTMNVAKRTMIAHMHATSSDFPITGAQLEMLGTIAHIGPLSSKELGSHLQLSPGGVSQLVEGLTRQALITREALPEDRRIQYLRVSPAGIAMLEKVAKPRQQMMEELMRHLTDEELEVWLGIQHKVIEQFQLDNPKITKGDK